MASALLKCRACNKPKDAENPLKQCSVCGTVTYCSVDCQRADWASHKADCTKSGCLQLITAIQENNADIVARLARTKRILNGKVDYTPPACTENPDPNVLGKWTALHECIRKSNLEMMRILIDNGVNVEIKDVDGETPVFVACTSGNPELVKMLLNAGANPNAQAQDGWSCLMMAARDSDYETTKALLDAGANLYGGSDMFGRTALDIVTAQATGQGVRRSEGESLEEALVKVRRVQSLLSEYESRNRY
jgi:ankyrin repeat protein